MVDNRSAESRSALMKRIRSRHTTPEMAVRRALHAMGFRFRLHRKDLPGTPDIVLGKRRVAVFVNGCFWHAHGCKIGRPPRSRPEFWVPKLDRNRQRDAEKAEALQLAGWHVITVWECETKETARLPGILMNLLENR